MKVGAAVGLIERGGCGKRTSSFEVAVEASSEREKESVMDMVIFRTIFFELLVFFTFTLLTLHFAY